MIWNRAQELTQNAISFVSVTIIDIKGSAPQDLGAKCLVSKNGLEAGTVGGGKVEARAIERSKEILESSEFVAPIQVTWNLQRDIKMTCGGEVTFLFEHFPATNWPIVIFGAGHVSQALSRALSKLKCQVTVVDSRKEWIEKLEGVKSICIDEPKDAVKSFSDKAFFISMTKGHAFDVPVLFEIYKNFPNAPYIGAIGSKSKANAIKKDLRELGVSEEFLDKLKIPLGLPIGSNDPEEISISIIAELLKVRDALQANS